MCSSQIGAELLLENIGCCYRFVIVVAYGKAFVVVFTAAIKEKSLLLQFFNFVDAAVQVVGNRSYSAEATLLHTAYAYFLSIKPTWAAFLHPAVTERFVKRLGAVENFGYNFVGKTLKLRFVVFVIESVANLTVQRILQRS